jgi:hypothetical protein
MRAVFVASDVSSGSIRAINYHPLVERLRAGGGARQVRPLKDWVTSLGEAYAAVLTRADCAPDRGDELLSQADAFSAEPAGRWIRGDLMRFVEKLRIRRGDVLIAGAGQIGPSTLFGRAIIADARLVGRLAAGDIMVLRGSGLEDDDFLFLYGFLLSSAGLNAVRACAYGTSIPRMRPDLLAETPVPMPTAALRARVAEAVRNAIVQRERYSSALASARQIVAGLPEMQQAHAMCAERRGRCLTWSEELPTMCAWNYASTGDALAFLRSLWPGRLRDVVSTIKPKNRFARIPCEPPHGVELVSQRDLFALRRVAQLIAKPRVPDEELFATPSTLLVARDGQFSEGSLFGRAELGSMGVTKAAISEHIMQVVCEPTWAHGLLAYLTSQVGQRLTRTTAVGTSIPTIREDLFLDLPVPDLDAHLRSAIDGLVAQAVEARLKAEDSENEAIRIIEEEVLPQWLG